MRIMIDLLHPAHVHFFKNFYFAMRGRGHDILVTARIKDCATHLLDRLAIPYRCISCSRRGAGGQIWEFLSRSARFVQLARRFAPDVLTGIMGPTIAVAGTLIRRPVYVFYDTEFARATNRFVYPLSTKVITPECYETAVGRNHLRYSGYHELAYLHPAHFVPSVEAVRAAGIDVTSPYIVVRFVGWWATHDRRERGLTPEQKIRVVERLESYGRVVVTSESALPDQIAGRAYRGPVESIHHVVAYASLYYGESATMASEAAVLGTPSIYIATTGRGYTSDLARFGLLTDFRDSEFEASLQRACRLLEDLDRTAVEADRNRRTMLSQRVDVTQFLVDLFEADFCQ